MSFLRSLYIALFPKNQIQSAKDKIENNDFLGAVRELHDLVRIKPKRSDVRILAGRACASINRIGTAKKHFLSVNPRDKNFIQALLGLGNVFFLERNYEAAINYYSKAIELGLNNELVWLNLAETYRKQNNYIKMRNCAEKVKALNASNSQAHYLIGESWRKSDEPKLARKAYQYALLIDSNKLSALESMVWMLQDCNQEQAALDEIESKLQTRTLIDEWRYLKLYGDILARNSHFDEAEAAYKKALLECSDSAELWKNLGIVLRDAARVSEAFACFDQAIAIDPDYIEAKWHRSLVHLLNYNFAKAWSDYEYRRLSKSSSLVRSPSVFEWRGKEDQRMNLLVYAEQGLGDEIMFASCIPELRSDVDQCFLECSKKLEKLFANSFPWLRVYGRDQDQLSLNNIINSNSSINSAIPMGSLPKIYKNDSSWKPAPSYLSPESASVSYWKRKLDKIGGSLKIGISWRGGTNITKSNSRSIDLEVLKPILDLVGCTFVSLQYGDVKGELDTFLAKQKHEVLLWNEALADYHETAALTKALDLVVSVQTSIVHLAGAMGVKTFAMIPFGPEWRYGSSGTQMRWYESVSLIRQNEKEDWSNVVDGVVDRIQLVKIEKNIKE